ncbi:hypothetical protein ACFW1P_33535 [Paenibacillus sp. NPDC058910]|uniref:hypothetical protein n=1 Tax=unclassified Paenibacillus TaxID=185978 RepID=UPI0036C802BC
MAEEKQQQEYEDLKDVTRKRMNGETAEALSPISSVMKGLSQGLESMKDSDYWLENVIPRNRIILAKNLNSLRFKKKQH